jgi:hypothetical protein
MVIGALLFAAFAFGVGWMARGAVLRFGAQRGAMMGQGYGRVPGYGQNQGYGQRGRGWCGNGQGSSQYDQGNGQYDQGQLPPGHPDIGGDDGTTGGQDGYGNGYGRDNGYGQGWGRRGAPSQLSTGTPQ